MLIGRLSAHHQRWLDDLSRDALVARRASFLIRHACIARMSMLTMRPQLSSINRPLLEGERIDAENDGISPRMWYRTGRYRAGIAGSAVGDVEHAVGVSDTSTEDIAITIKHEARKAW